MLHIFYKQLMLGGGKVVYDFEWIVILKVA